jgi:hypothetical protein
MGTLKGFPNPPALWLRQAKPAYANAINGNPVSTPSLDSLGLAVNLYVLFSALCDLSLW